MNDLILMSGSETATWADLQAAPTPASTKTWTPIPHAELVGGVRDTLIRSGLTVQTEQHGLSRSGARYFGTMELTHGNDGSDYATIVGLRNSHDKTFPAGLTVGARVMVCDNLSFSGQIVIARKHTRWIRQDLPRLIETAVGNISLMRRTQEERFAAYKEFTISDKDAHDMIIQALDVKAISTRMIPTVVQEWRSPSHEEFASGGPTLWRFFNGVTEALKTIKVESIPRRTIALHGLLDSACGLAV